MSRIGNKSIDIPDKVKINVGNGGVVAVEGPKGKLAYTLPPRSPQTVTRKFTFARPTRSARSRRCTVWRAAS